ncbi:MAG: FecR family protein [Proteobacteria bacterium]|nr:FecR family protein [Pseudomonadota bacterium]
MTFLQDRDFKRWAELVDRQEAGEQLSPEQEAFVLEHTKTNPLARREQELLAELSDLGASPEGLEHLVKSALDRTTSGPAGSGLQPRSAGLEPAPLGAPQLPPRPQDATASRTQRQPGGAQRVHGRLRFGWRTGAIVAAAAAAVLLLPWLDVETWLGPPAFDSHAPRQQASRCELVYGSGSVTVAGRPLRAAGTLVTQGQLVRTGDGLACLSIDPGIDLCLDRHTSVRLSKLSGPDREVALLDGKAAAVLARQPEGHRFSVVASDTWVTAIGTAFTVDVREASQGVVTTVLQGSVRIGQARQGQVVRAHRRAVRRRHRLDIKPVTRTTESREWGALHLGSLWKGPHAASLQASALGSGEALWLDDKPLGQAPLSSLIPAGRHVAEIRVGRAVRARIAFTAQPGQHVLLTPDMFEPLVPSPPARSTPIVRKERRAPAKPASRLSVIGLLHDAHHSMQQGQWLAAAAAYRKLGRAFPESSEAHTALVPLARLELDRLSSPRSALKRLDRYLGRGGSLTEEARYMRIRSLRALGRTAQARRASVEFLERHPESLHADSIRTGLAGEEPRPQRR